MSTSAYDCIIIGGGISGISFAHYLNQQGKRTLVLEKRDVTGGQVQSPTTHTDPNYWRELGAHTCYNSYTALLRIVETLEVDYEVQALGKGSYKVFADGEVKSPMSQINFLSLILNGPKIFFSKREGKTVQEYFQNIVGKRNYAHLFTRLFRAVLSQNADQYPAEVFLKRRQGRLKEHPRKITFSKGLHTIIDLMVDKNQLEVMTNSEVQSIAHSGASYTVTTHNGTHYTAPNIALATDPQTTALLVKDLEADLAQLLTSIPMSHSESMSVVLQKENLATKLVAGIIPVSDEFHSAVSRDLLEDKKLRSFTFHFPRGVKNREQKIALICQVLKTEYQHLLEVEEDSHILPSLRLSHLRMSEQVSEAQKRSSIYVLGNYFYGLSLEDCVSRSQDESLRFNRSLSDK